VLVPRLQPPFPPPRPRPRLPPALLTDVHPDIKKLAHQRVEAASLQADLSRAEEEANSLQQVVERLEQQILAESSELHGKLSDTDLEVLLASKELAQTLHQAQQQNQQNQQEAEPAAAEPAAAAAAAAPPRRR
jgi:hypothetical protein